MSDGGHPMRGSVRIAAAVGYLGAAFCGSQIQPNVPTVQGTLQHALVQLTWAEPGHNSVTLSSRTDAGVDARMNIASFDLPERIWEQIGARGVITALNDQTPVDVRVWAAEQVGAEFRTRNAVTRTYLYRLQALEGWPLVSPSDLAEWCSIFVGEHDFTNFSRPQEHRSPVKRVIVCEPWLDASGGVLGFRIEADGFVWNQVRRLASALYEIAIGRRTLEEVRQGLIEPGIAADFGRCEPEWLTLWSIHHLETPVLSAAAQVEVDLPLSADPPPRGRAYGLWAKRARGEQVMLHQTIWLAHLR